MDMDCNCTNNNIVLKAISEVQDKCKDMQADAQSSGPSKHKYLTLTGAYNIVKPILKQLGLFVHHYQCTEESTGKQLQITVIRHLESGQSFRDIRYLSSDKPGSQGLGSAETYMKRYALVSILGIALGEEDDDGESERLYASRIDALMKMFPKKFSDPKKVYDDFLKYFKIDHHYKLGEHRLFDAACWILEQVGK